jgi:hypothetical protein
MLATRRDLRREERCIVVHNLLARLDSAAFLGFKVWEFSYRSLRMEYGLTFLKRVLLPHPVRALAGLVRYPRLQIENRSQGSISLLFEGPEEGFVARLSQAQADLLVAVGFCQKPLEPACPAGRPNHDCTYLDTLDQAGGGGTLHPACAECEITGIGTLALQAGASMYIMTSALDIARDVMIPTVDHGRFQKVIMCLCPYSVQAIALPLVICGLEGYLVAYESGNCVDWEQWLQADRGIKKGMTAVDPEAYSKVLTLLERCADQRASEGVRFNEFQREGNIHTPVRASWSLLRG